MTGPSFQENSREKTVLSSELVVAAIVVNVGYVIRSNFKS